MSDYIPTIDDLRVKLCYICREEETYDKPEYPPRKWTHPCQCTLLAHEDCLLEWIKTAQTKSSTTAADNALKCPQCGARYQLESDLPLSMRMMNEALTAWNKSLGRMGRWFLALVPVGIVAGVAVGTHFVLTQYGAYAVKEFFGKELFNAVLTSDPHNWSISALINLPLIPIGLICYRFNSSYNLFPAISTLLEWPSLHKRGLPQHNTNVLAWPPSPFTVGFIAMPIVRYLYGKCLDRFTRWLLGPTPRTLLGRAAGNRPVIDRADDDEDRMLILRFRGGQGPEPENENQGNDADGNQASLTIYASPLGRKIGGALLIPFIARRMGNLLLRFSKRSEFLRRLLAVRPPSSTSSTWPFSSASSSSLFSGKIASGIATSPLVTWKLVLRAIWGGGRAWAEFDPVWWRNTLGFGLFVVAKDALHLLHLYLVKKEVDTRRVRNRDFRDVDISSLDVMPDLDARRRSETDSAIPLPPSKLCESCRLPVLGCALPSSNSGLSKLNDYLSQHSGNHLASDDELPLLERYLSGAESEAEQYDKEIERVARLLDELKATRASISRAVARFSATFRSSIRKLPVEILSKIFLLYTHEHTEASNEHPSTHPALTLGRVCSRWRTIVDSTPRLWCIMDASALSDIHAKDDGSEHSLRLTRFCIENSRNMPLEIRFKSCPKSLDRSFLELLKHSDRWKVVVLEEWVSLYGRVFPVDLPMLESLDLSVSPTSPGIFSLRERFPQNVSTPNLRQLSLSGWLVTTLGPRFDTSSLTTFSVRGMVHYPSFLDTLERSPMLSKLQLSTVTFLERGLVDFPIALPQLKELSSDNHDVGESPNLESSLPYFLHDIVAPKLEYISIFDNKWKTILDTETTVALRDFLRRSASPNLTRLRFIQINFREIRYCFDILELVSSTITTLELWCNHNSLEWDEFLRRVTVDPDFLPKLKELTLLFNRWSDDSETLLYEMVESRRNWEVETQRLSKLRVVCTKAEYRDTVGGRLAPFEGKDFRLSFS
ncbi:hypothetical protein PQX77_000812 [Marasmius sp. AFHP31]|nr:hypothetical protein PQX77_000812 [Marasmius sp. AFHP31]